MAESAIHFEGIDEATRQRVRIHLTVVTSEEPTPAVELFAAPRGFLPEAGRRTGEISSREAQTVGSAGGASSALPHAFASPRGFLPEV